MRITIFWLSICTLPLHWCLSEKLDSHERKITLRNRRKPACELWKQWMSTPRVHKLIVIGLNPHHHHNLGRSHIWKLCTLNTTHIQPAAKQGCLDLICFWKINLLYQLIIDKSRHLRLYKKDSDDKFDYF